MICFEKTLIESLVRRLLLIGRVYKWLNLDGVIFAASSLVGVKLISLGRSKVATVIMSVVAENHDVVSS